MERWSSACVSMHLQVGEDIGTSGCAYEGGGGERVTAVLVLATGVVRRFGYL